MSIPFGLLFQQPAKGMCLRSASKGVPWGECRYERVPGGGVALDDRRRNSEVPWPMMHYGDTPPAELPVQRRVRPAPLVLSRR